MLDWIRSVFNDIYNYIGRWASSLLNAIGSVWSFAQWIYNTLWGYISSVSNWAYNEAQSLWGFVNSVYNYARWLLDVVISGVRDFAVWVYHSAINLAMDIYHWAVGQVEWLKNLVTSLVDSAIRWVIQNIWNPLFADIRSAWNWIWNAGAWMWDVLTHPEKLAKILAVWAFREVPPLIIRFARPLGRWFTHTMLSMANEAYDVIEAIIAAII